MKYISMKMEPNGRIPVAAIIATGEKYHFFGGIGRGQPCTRVGAVPTPQKERPRRVPPRTCTKIIIIK